jgi:hypothetical protein
MREEQGRRIRHKHLFIQKVSEQYQQSTVGKEVSDDVLK